jgi:aconitate hydratase
VLAESFERIHRSNLISMGVVPLRFAAGEGWRALGLDGIETFTLVDLRRAVLENVPVRVEASGERGVTRFQMLPDVHTGFERSLLSEGGMLPAMMRNLTSRTRDATA